MLGQQPGAEDWLEPNVSFEELWKPSSPWWLQAQEMKGRSPSSCQIPILYPILHTYPRGGEGSDWISGSWSQCHGCLASLVTCCIWKHCWGWAWVGIWTCDLPLLPTPISGKLTSKSACLRGQWGRVQKSGPPEFKCWFANQVPLGKQFNCNPQFTHLQNRDDDSNDLPGWL